MRIAVVDDRAEDRQALAAEAAACCERMHLPCTLAEYPGGDAFLAAFEPEQWDVLFLDIYMNGTNGMETARQVRQADRQVHIVFVTVTDQYAVNGYEVHAAHYLIKPITPASVEAALRACLTRQSLRQRTLTIRQNHREHRVLYSSILYTTKERNRVLLYTTRGVLTVYMSFLKFAPQLLEDARFIQCGYGTLLNLEHVARLEKDTFVMDNEDRLHIPRRERGRVRAAWTSFEAALQEEWWGETAPKG